MDQHISRLDTNTDDPQPNHRVGSMQMAAHFTIIYRDLPSLIRARTQATPAFLMPEGVLRGCHEGFESRLAEVDAGREDRRRVHRAGDDEPGPSPVASGRRISSANVSPQIDHCGSSRRILRWISLSDRC